MASPELEVQEKKELDSAEEKTEPGMHFVPNTDIHEGADSIVVTMDMPGVSKGDVDVRLDKNILTIAGNVDHTRYAEFTPVYTEYNVGHFSRRFTVSNEIDQDSISATIADGVLNVTLPKQKKPESRRIPID